MAGSPTRPNSPLIRPTSRSIRSRRIWYCATRSRLGTATCTSTVSRTLTSPLAQQLAVRLEPLLDALGVVHPVDAEDDLLGVAEVVAQPAGPGGARRAGRRARPSRRCRWRPGTRRCAPPGRRRRSAGRWPAAPSTLVASWAKLCAAWARWKPTRSAPSMPAQQLGPAGELHEQLRRRERHVQEEADPQVGAERAEHARAPVAGGSPAPRPPRPARPPRRSASAKRWLTRWYASHQRRWYSGCSTASW